MVIPSFVVQRMSAVCQQPPERASAPAACPQRVPMRAASPACMRTWHDAMLHMHARRVQCVRCKVWQSSPAPQIDPANDPRNDCRPSSTTRPPRSHRGPLDGGSAVPVSTKKALPAGYHRPSCWRAPSAKLHTRAQSRTCTCPLNSIFSYDCCPLLPCDAMVPTHGSEPRARQRRTRDARVLLRAGVRATAAPD